MDLGQGYKNDQAYATFVEYIARVEQQEILVRILTFRLIVLQTTITQQSFSASVTCL